MTEEMRWQAVLDNDSRYDGIFYYAVSSTGIFCRPSCCSRPPRRDRVRFFETREQAMAEGYRPCKRCRPDLVEYAPKQALTDRAMEILQRQYLDPEQLDLALRALGVSRRHLTMLFREQYRTTIGEHLAKLRIAYACKLLRESELPIPELAAESGFGSLPAFYRAFRRDTGTSPAAYRKKERIMT